MDHLAGVAVAVLEKEVHDKVPEHLVGIERIFEIGLLRKRLQCRDQTLLIGLRDRCLRVVEDVGIAADLVIGIFQLDIVAAHAETAEAALSAFAAEHL